MQASHLLGGFLSPKPLNPPAPYGLFNVLPRKQVRGSGTGYPPSRQMVRTQVSHFPRSKEKRIWFRFQIRFVLKLRQNALGLHSSLLVVYPTISLLNAILAQPDAIPAYFSPQSAPLIAEPTFYDMDALPAFCVPRARYSGFGLAIYYLHCGLLVERCKS